MIAWNEYLYALLFLVQNRERWTVALGIAQLTEFTAPTPGELARLAAEGARLGARIAVGDVLRFTPIWQSLHQVVATGTIGRLMTIRLEENIGFWHYAHSFVRGNWRRSEDSSPMVLAKTCHDLRRVER